jgi:hypothetical protein
MPAQPLGQCFYEPYATLPESAECGIIFVAPRMDEFEAEEPIIGGGLLIEEDDELDEDDELVEGETEEEEEADEI